ncbi:hypothetical protein EYZ11_012963 [Aspergillus tanneri]|uniref:AAA+ ATPase domain-containing protein n=1 Tax=Aspergillus tanneri TaxID=1220188 RepID=A0A4S3J498_9EURO|nr:hypothetical protein EYZ11_012963 [Aspergillus tanneri]
MTSLTHNDYTIAWICALPLEVAAARAMLNKIHCCLPRTLSDPNAYELGELNGHYIVIACLPAGVYGTVSAATVVSRMCVAFPRLQYGLMVGIGGGVPGKNNDIRLGDVVVSKPVGKYSGVIQYDYGKAVQGGHFEPTGTLNKPPQALLTHMSQLEAKQMTGGEDDVLKIVLEVLERNPNMQERFSPPEQHTDTLFHFSYHHADKEDSCKKTPSIHYGLIASGDQVMKDSETRDRLAQRHGILCFEMEAAGLMDELPTLVIRGICDYCDSHKQKEWQGYAALTAAAYTKILLSVMPICRTDRDLIKCNRVRHWVVSLAKNPKFVGRHDEITKLENLITMPDGPRRIAITGLGGVGKTQVALELAHRIWDQDKERSVFWIPCTSHAMIEQTFLRFAETLGLHNVKPAEVKEQIKIYLSSERAGKWLLIFDNADDAEMWLTANDKFPALEDLLPEGGQNRILFTTRNRKLAMKLAPFNAVPIPDVNKETALKILESTLTNKGLLKDSMITATLLEQLAFLPLAIAQASAYIIENGINLSTYLALLQEQEQDTVELLSEDFRDPGRYKDIQNPVINCLASDGRYYEAELFYNKLMRINQNKIGPEHPDTLTSIESLASTYWNQGRWNEAEKLEVQVMETRKTVLGAKHPDTLTSMANLALTYRSQGQWNKAEKLFVHVMETGTTMLGAEHPDTLTSMTNLASTYRSQGRWNEAEKLEVQVMETSKTVLGAKHPDTLTSMANLASTYWNQGRWNEAEKLEVQVMETRKTVLGAKHPDTLTSMANLASTYQSKGRWNEAEKLEVQVMETRKAVLGAEHPDTLTSMANLASTFWNQGRWNEAEKLEVQVMETRKTVLGAEHPDTLTSMNNLAYTWKSQGKLQDALALIKKCSDLRSRMSTIHYLIEDLSLKKDVRSICHKFQQSLQQLW